MSTYTLQTTILSKYLKIFIFRNIFGTSATFIFKKWKELDTISNFSEIYSSHLSVSYRMGRNYFYGSWKKLVAESFFLGMLPAPKTRSSFLARKSIAVVLITHFKYKSSFTYSEEGTSFSVSVFVSLSHTHTCIHRLKQPQFRKTRFSKTCRDFFLGVKKSYYSKLVKGVLLLL